MFIKEGFIKEGFIRSNPSNLTNCGGNAFVKEGFVKGGFIKSDGSCRGDEFIVKTITITTSNAQNQNEQKILSFLEQKETNNVKLIANLITPNAVWVIPSAFLQSKGLKTYENKSFDENKVRMWLDSETNTLKEDLNQKIKREAVMAVNALKNEGYIENIISNSLSENQLNILANKIIEILEINGKEINYSPTMANVTIFKDGNPINVPLRKNNDGSLKGTLSLYGDDDIYIEIK